MTRKLASVQRLVKIKPIKDADSIDVADVLGWHVVVKKGEFQVGDLCIYCEIDSLMPATDQFAFLEKYNYRIKTQKLRGVISQGLCLPMNLLPPKDTPYEEGEDVTELLGIIKFEPVVPTHLSGLVKGSFPPFIPKTDEDRIQIRQDILDEYAEETCVIHEKLDGTSLTAFLELGAIQVCSRNLWLSETAGNTYWRAIRENKIEEKLKHAETIMPGLVFQGELIGPGINKNYYNALTLQWRIFYVYSLDQHKYLDTNLATHICKEVGLELVPFIKQILALSTVDRWVTESYGKSLLNPERNREGIVVRIKTETDRNQNKISFKVINPDFLLKQKD